ncbi:Nramp family divalent metal transporter [Chroococcidiopsis sp. CCNUC1]|uniref:Nramp family divalent metal transporter n=1 Tax=Chroococcidiopsis sp. CCNUC1 TaxID=2653189 RepID=UPI002021B10E|nr:Nramp family divalent metal transporter [Chroococcidiopsis sp. CCNUC1]URD51968.1 Nramp family divalent metal transporter [Chroococcidiopsis sp. CCNUC1]
MDKVRDPATKYAIYVATAVLVLGFIITLVRNGIQILADATFWLGLYGWLAAGIVVGYLVYLGLRILGWRSSEEAEPNVVDTSGVIYRAIAPTATERGTEAIATRSKISAGELPPWEVADLPAPPPFSFNNAIALIGPGAILLGTSIGSGEWLLGPAVTAQYGGFMLWIATTSIILQVLMNMEFIRYTLYTGEPIYTGFMRTKPGPRFWAIFYSVLAFLQLGWPGWASSAATALTAMFVGDIPGPEHAETIKAFGLFWFLSTVAIVAFGAKIERTMEVVQWFFVGAILLFLIVIALGFTAPETWGRAAMGFLRFGTIPPNVDWLKVGGFAAFAGAGGVLNGTLSNWFRDKGLGMGGVVGYIPALIGGRRMSLTPTGKVFPLTTENKKRWREWWKYAITDQYGVWVLGCFLGMGLPALLTLQFIPPGTRFDNQFAIAVYQAQYLSREDTTSIMWFITLLVGFWILYSTQLGITDVFARMVTDMVWSGSSHIRAWRGEIFVLFTTASSLCLLCGEFLFSYQGSSPFS